MSGWTISSLCRLAWPGRWGRRTTGSPDYQLEWHEATWQFTSAEHRDRFEVDPEVYAPQYGGWCAWAAARGEAASTVPEAWKVVDDKLYLNYSRFIQWRWERDIPGYIEAADAHWRIFSSDDPA
ncbi:YHS domain-containing (seleno)protein [Halomonas sp. 25-S5]|uniref:YHS domain-containing (seleno)protein n=1 Tax=Halomonas sp. 25-S5 TaxID=2994065 RepID=UPI002468B3E8|nr:YHS domain-containing (seleno)protein [Halomonas sp. 25-S5]